VSVSQLPEIIHYIQNQVEHHFNDRYLSLGGRVRTPTVKNTRARVESAERAAEWPASFPEITFVESDSMAFQKLTKLLNRYAPGSC
jgi:hypothetical protein